SLASLRMLLLSSARARDRAQARALRGWRARRAQAAARAHAANDPQPALHRAPRPARRDRAALALRDRSRARFDRRTCPARPVQARLILAPAVAGGRSRSVAFSRRAWRAATVDFRSSTDGY